MKNPLRKTRRKLRGLDDKDLDSSEVHKARQYALKLLSYRGRSEKELVERLIKKGLTEPLVSSTIRYLKSAGLIDDRVLAEFLKRKALTTKLLGKKGARRFLLDRGIPRGIVDIELSYDEKEDIENAKILVEKKLKTLRDCSSETGKRRLYNLLLRRGYSFDTINKVLKNKNVT
jgi:regulatory protein